MANPSPELHPENLTPWQPGQSGNPGGKSAEQKRREMRNAEMATKLQEFLLEREIAAITDPADTEASKLVRETLGEVLSPAQLQTVLSTLTVALNSDRLKLIKDAQDRGLGAPTNKTALTDPDGNAMGGKFTLEFISPPGSGES
jgi:hypothetical protein